MKRLWVFLHVAIFIAQHVNAKQEFIDKDGEFTIQDTTKNFIITPFNENLEKLPTNFIGHDPKLIYKTVSDKIKEKGEYESSSEYKTRMKQTAKIYLFDQLNTQSIFAVSIRVFALYNPDKRQLEILEYLDKSPFYDNSDGFAEKPGIEAIREEKILETYVGENAFGVKREIVKKEKWSYLILFKNPKHFLKSSWGSSFMNMELKVPMDTTTAKVAKLSCRLLIVFELVPPYTKKNTSYHTPKIDSPRNETIHEYYICAVVKSLWLYNSITGDVYAKVTQK